jgi:hypothetical protein
VGRRLINFSEEKNKGAPFSHLWEKVARGSRVG